MSTSNDSQPLAPGTRVRTTQENPEPRNSWANDILKKRQWGVEGKVRKFFFDAPSGLVPSGLSYAVDHEDGTWGSYVEEELEVIVAQQAYLLTAEATWIASYEHQSGGRDMHHPESRALSARFEAIDLDAARLEAKRLLAEFEADLPKKREGGTSWQDKDAEIVSTTFALILEL